MQINSQANYNIGTNYQNGFANQDRDDVEGKSALNRDKLSSDEQRQLSQLQSRDTEVKAHEAAHQSGGGAVGGATYTYEQGPDGKMYAIGGEVPVSFREGSTPQETIANAKAVISSALAPADPSGQDMAVASSATLMMIKAQQELTRETNEKISGIQTYQNESNYQGQKDKNSTESLNISA